MDKQTNKGGRRRRERHIGQRGSQSMGGRKVKVKESPCGERITVLQNLGREGVLREKKEKSWWGIVKGRKR